MRALAMVAILLLAGCLSAEDGDTEQTVADTLLLRGGLVWSPGMDAPMHADVLVEGDRIVQVGNIDATATRTIELNGSLVLPGFRDAHMHALRSRSLEPDFPTPSQLEQIQSDANNQIGQTSYHGRRHVHYQSGDTDGDDPAEYEHCTAPDTSRIEAVKAQFRQAETLLARQGITTVVDAGMSDLTLMAALKDMESDGENKVRWLIRVKGGCYDLLDQMGVVPHEGDWVRWYGVKLYGDGYLGARVAALRDDYSDQPAWQGLLVHTDDALDALIAEADARGLHIGTHAIGDASMAQVLDAYERAGIGPDDRWTIEHSQVTDPALIQRYAELGVVPSIQLSFATTDQRMAADRLGPREAAAYDWQGFRDAGVVVAGGSDYPIEVINPLWGLQRETTRQELDGTPDGGYLADGGLGLDGAIESITFGAAYAAHEDHERGAISVGHIADLVIVQENLFAIDESIIADSTIVLTMVNGKITFEGEASYPPPV